MRTMQVVCGISCAIEHSRALTAKKKAKEHKEAKDTCRLRPAGREGQD